MEMQGLFVPLRGDRGCTDPIAPGLTPTNAQRGARSPRGVPPPKARTLCALRKPKNPQGVQGAAAPWWVFPPFLTNQKGGPRRDKGPVPGQGKF